MIGFLSLAAAVILYILAAAAFLVFIFRQNKSALGAGFWLFGSAFALQSVSLIARSFQLGQLPIFNLTEALGFFGWALAGVFLLLSSRFNFPALGAFVAPPASILVFLSAVMPAGPQGTGPVFMGLWLTVHLAAIFIGYGFFALSFVAGIMYLLQEHQIKAKLTGPLHRRLPSLKILDSLNFYCLTLGFPLMTLGLVVGSIYAYIALGAFWQWDPKEIWTVITWLVYAVLLHQRLTVGWRGRRAALMSIFGFSVLCFTFLVVSHLFPGYHTFENLERLQMK